MFNGITGVDIPFALENRFVKLDRLSSEIAHLGKHEAKLEIIESHEVFKQSLAIFVASVFLWTPTTHGNMKVLSPTNMGEPTH